MYIDRVATSHEVCARAHRPCCNVTRGVRTCTLTVLQRHTGCAHVHTDRVATSHGACARAHRPCCNVTRGVRTCTPTVLQCHTGCAHVYTGRVATSPAVCARVHRPCCNVTRGVRTCTPAVVQCTRGVRTCTPAVLQRHTGCAHVHTGRVAASHGVCARVHRPCHRANPHAALTDRRRNAALESATESVQTADPQSPGAHCRCVDQRDRLVGYGGSSCRATAGRRSPASDRVGPTGTCRRRAPLVSQASRRRDWKTGRISAGGFRGIVVTETRLMGEARHPSRQEWCGFSVDLASSEVRVRS
jgi:hypothetical protein